MISFRYHIVSIVSVFLALAVGVALGGGPLKGEVDKTLVEQVETDRKAKETLAAEITDLRDGTEFTDSFAEAVAPALLSGRLRGRPVIVLTLPDAQQTVVRSVEELILLAGGTVGGTLRIGEDLVDVGSKPLVDELATQLLDGTRGVEVAENATGYETMGALVARAVGTSQDRGASVDQSATSILSGLSTAELMSPDGDVERRGSLAVLITGAGSGSSQEQQGANAIVTALARAMQANTDGLVVAGPVAAARDGGLVQAVRRDVVAAREISTVDSLGRTAGQVVTVLALAGQAAGSSGHYGAVDAADGALPGAPLPAR